MGADHPQSSQLVRDVGRGGLAYSSPSQISICSTRLLRPHLGGHVKFAVAEAQTFMAAPCFAFVLLILGVLAPFSQTRGE